MPVVLEDHFQEFKVAWSHNKRFHTVVDDGANEEWPPMLMKRFACVLQVQWHGHWAVVGIGLLYSCIPIPGGGGGAWASFGCRSQGLGGNRHAFGRQVHILFHLAKGTPC